MPYFAPIFYAPTYYGGSVGAHPLSSASIPYFERDLLAFLEATSGLTVYPGHFPQKYALPSISFLLIFEEHGHKLSGGAGFVESDFQITVASRSYIDCGTIAERLRSALQGYRGLMGSSLVFAVVAGTRLTQYQAAVDGSDRGVHLKTSEFEIHYRETIPRT